MNLSNADIILLEDYWANRLTEEAKKQLEKRLEEDMDFQKAAAEWELIVTEGVIPPESEAEELNVIKERLLSYNSQETTPEAKVIKRQRFTQNRLIYIGLGIAASIAILLWVNPLGIGSTSSSYDAFFTHLSRDNANLSNEAVDGKKAYDENNYELAYPALLEEVAAGGDSLNLIYAAVAAIGSQQSEKAIPILEPLVDNTNWEFYQTEIKWYLALAYCKADNSAKARTILENIINEKGTYATEAQALLEEISKN